MEEILKVAHTVYRVSDFLSWQRQGNLNLRPPFQRGSVWSDKARSYFLDTIVRGFPVPVILLKDETDPKTFEPRRLVVDGQQRLRTVLGFIDRSCLSDPRTSDAFTMMRTHNRELAGRAFDELPEEARQRILGFELSVHVLPSTTPDRLLLETFARMNSTGVRANDQELRNAEQPGAFKQLAYSLAYGELERWLLWRVFSRSQIARMKDAELTSELLMFLLSGFSGKSQRAIDAAYKSYDNDVPHERSLARRLVQVLDRLDETYSDSLNEVYSEEFGETPLRTQGFFYPLFCFVCDQMYDRSVSAAPEARSKAVDVRKLREHLTKKVEVLRAGRVDEELLKSLRGAATDTSSRRTRYEFLADGWKVGR